jgi:hypothetical protein
LISALEGDAARLVADISGGLGRPTMTVVPGSGSAPTIPFPSRMVCPRRLRTHNVFALGRGPRQDGSLDLGLRGQWASPPAQRTVHISQHKMNFFRAFSDFKRAALRP